MNFSLKQIIDALETLCVLDGDKAPILLKLDEARQFIKTALQDMDSLSVQGRGALDTLLGCMMGLESIVGKEDADG